MISAGIDLGGTKIETQIFDTSWTCVDRIRQDTPKCYNSLLKALEQAYIWIQSHQSALPIGIGAAGLVSPKTGRALTANLPANGQRIIADIAARFGRNITYLNDGSAFTLSEAIFGNGRPYRIVAGLILGTGTGGGVVIDGHLPSNHSGVAGEFGHIQAPAALLQKYDLPVISCGCGRLGCIETLVSGPGITRIAKMRTKLALSPKEIARERESSKEIEEVFRIWCTLVAELCLTIEYCINPDVIVLGGGLSKIQNVEKEILEQLQSRQFQGFNAPKIVVAAGGASSGARGAAYAAWQDTQCQAEYL